MDLIDGSTDLLDSFQTEFDAEFEALWGTEALAELKRNRWDKPSTDEDNSSSP